MPRHGTIHVPITAEMIQQGTITGFKQLPGPGVWDPMKTRAQYRGKGPFKDRMAYWMFRVTGSEEFFHDCFKVEVVGSHQVVIWYYLKNRKGKRYIDPLNREEAAKAALVLNWVEIPDWMRQ